MVSGLAASVSLFTPELVLFSSLIIYHFLVAKCLELVSILSNKLIIF